MKKTIHMAAAVMTVVLALAGCARLNEPECSEGTEITITASFAEDQTKTTVLNGGAQVYWEPGDEISVFCGSNSARFTTNNSSVSATAEFIGSISVSFGSTNTFWGLYPYDAGSTFDGSAVMTTLPGEQTGRIGSFGKGYNIALAKSNDFSLRFYNVCGGVRFSLTKSGVKKVMFEAIGGESIAGKVKLSFEDGVPTMKDVVEGVSSVTVTAPDEGCFETGKWYYAVTLPGTLEKGFRMTFITDIEQAVLTSGASRTIKRGIYGSLPEVDKNLNYESKDSHEMVDLGLSVKWATCNVGAAKPEEIGDYYAWGETQTKTSFGWSNYIWCNGNENSLKKYILQSSFGTVDNKSDLDAEDDVACVKWGGNWRMPTLQECIELVSNCACASATENGISGYRITGKKTGYTDKSIFIPKYDKYSECWSKSIGGTNWPSKYSVSFGFDSGMTLFAVERYKGLPVRPVYGDSEVKIIVSPAAIDLTPGSTCELSVSPESVVSGNYSWSSSDEKVATVSNAGVVRAIGTGNCNIVFSSESGSASSVIRVVESYPESVDMGLSVRWATKNVGAVRPEGFGGYYAWGELLTKNVYIWDNYSLSKSSDYFYEYNSFSKYGVIDNKDKLDLSDDIAHVANGQDCRMPTDDEWEELKTNCTWVKTRINGVYGILVTSSIPDYTSNSIFLPACGLYFEGEYGKDDGEVYGTLIEEGSMCAYWSSSLYASTISPLCAVANVEMDFGAMDRCCGLSVRPVYDSSIVPASSVQINPADVSIVVGATKQLSATVSPQNATDKTVTWSSSDEKIATVSSDGLVTGVSAGTCTVTASASINVKSTCSVTVTDSSTSHEYVDLGLSVKWATCNIGATSPEEYGDYYAWGDVTGQTWNGSSWSGGGFSTKHEYELDSNRNLKPEYDAAHVILGDRWRIPNWTECEELSNNCTSTWTTDYKGTGVAGRVFTSNKEGYTDKSIFLPAAGFGHSTGLCYAGSYGYYYTSNFLSHDCIRGLGLFSDEGVGANDIYCTDGQSIRPIYELDIVPVSGLQVNPEAVSIVVGANEQLNATVTPQDATDKTVVWSSSNEKIATVSSDGLVTGISAGTCTVTASAGNNVKSTCSVTVTAPTTSHEYVDLGLSVKWATCNVGATKPEEFGRYFGWGDVKGQTWNGSSWSGGGFSTSPDYELDSNKNLKPEYDAAHVNLGGSWRMPTKEECEELIDNCTKTWTTDYKGTGVAGWIFTSKKEGCTDKSIFLPAAGFGRNGNLDYAGSFGYFWSSTFYYDDYAWGLYFYSGGVYADYGYRSSGQSVRPVSE